MSACGRLCALIPALALTPEVAQAYVDPGSGALLWQLLAGGAFAMIYALRNAVSRPWDRIRRKHRKDPPEVEPEDGEE